MNYWDFYKLNVQTVPSVESIFTINYRDTCMILENRLTAQ